MVSVDIRTDLSVRSVASAVAQGMEAAVISTICAQHRCGGGDARGREGRADALP
jgi:hypothetical protein